MIFIMYVCVASRWFSVRGIHSTDTIFLSHGVEGRGRPCRIMCRLSERRPQETLQCKLSFLFESYYQYPENLQSRPRIVETKSISSSEIFHIQTEHNWFLSKLCVSNMSIFKSWWSSIFFTAANRSFTSMLVKKKLFKRILGKESWKKVQKVAIF